MKEKRLRQLYWAFIISMFIFLAFIAYSNFQRTEIKTGDSGIRYSIHKDGSEVFVHVSVRNDEEIAHDYMYKIMYFWENQTRNTSLPVHFEKGTMKTSKISTIIYTPDKVGVNLRIFKEGELVESGTLYTSE